MATPDELVKMLDFLAPAVAGQTEEDKKMALALAEPYRPGCLKPAQQDIAQCWYAAWLLYQRMQQQATDAGSGTASGGVVVPFGVASEKEGDLSRSYFASGGGSGGDASDPAKPADPMGYWANWQRLAALCGYGAITVGAGRGCGCVSAYGDDYVFPRGW